MIPKLVDLVMYITHSLTTPTHSSLIHSLIIHSRWVSSYELNEHYKPPYTVACQWEGNILYSLYKHIICHITHHSFLFLYSSLGHHLSYVEGLCFDTPYNQGQRSTWKPSGHLDQLLEFSNRDMCRIMNGRNIMFAGDSLTDEFFATLVSFMLSSIVVEVNSSAEAIGAKYHQANKMCEEFCPWDKNCEGPAIIECGPHLPSFKLYTQMTADLSIPDDGSRNHWLQYIKDHNISLLILNAGAHYRQTPELLSNVRKALTMAYKIKPDISVIWRTSYAGHPHCVRFFDQDPSVMRDNEAYNAIYGLSHYEASFASHHWKDIEEQNIDVVNMTSMEFPQVFHLDITTPTKFRTDSHSHNNNMPVDCLHYCRPGPIDDWVVFLYNALVAITNYPELGTDDNKDDHSDNNNNNNNSNNYSATEELPTMMWERLSSNEVEGLIFYGVKIPLHFYLIEKGTRRRILNVDYLALVTKIQAFQVQLRGDEGIGDRDHLVRSIGDDFLWNHIPVGPPIL